MNSYKEIYDNLCRICLSYGSNQEMVSLIENFNEKGLSVYGKAVLNFANISIKTSHNLPCKMCKNCLILLKQAICFKLKCESSEKRLKDCVEIYQKTKDSEAKIEEIVVDNIMFSKYFPEETSRETNIHRTNKSNINISSGNGEQLSSCESEISQGNDDDFKQDSDSDSLDDILNLMEQNIGQYWDGDKNKKQSNENTDRQYTYKKLILRSKKQAKLEAMQVKNQHIKNAIKLKKLKSKILETSKISKDKFFCKICNKHYANRSSYRCHIQRHNGCSYICEHCGKGFPSLSELNLHQVARHGSGSYIQCKLCDFKASCKFLMIEHERLHTGERPYTCDKCGLTFRRRAIWRKHMIYHAEKTVQCPQCPKKFYQRGEMLAHMNGMHERMYLYACHKCNVTYAKTASVRRHLTEKHGIPREEQGKIVRINKRK